jgi:hypothetical protein
LAASRLKARTRFRKLPREFRRKSWFCTDMYLSVGCLEVPQARWLCRKRTIFSRQASAGVLVLSMSFSHQRCILRRLKSSTLREPGGFRFDSPKSSSSATASCTVVWRSRNAWISSGVPPKATRRSRWAAFS